MLTAAFHRRADQCMAALDRVDVVAGIPAFDLMVAAEQRMIRAGKALELVAVGPDVALTRYLMGERWAR